MTEFPGLVLPNELHLNYLGDGEWKLLKPYSAIWYSGRVVVPTGFATDLSSIPRIARSIIPQIGNQNGPSVVHDWCYHNRWRTRRLSDTLFLEGMAVARVNWARRNMMYAAVRFGGWVTWNLRQKE
jgi:hypothetical protein